MTTCGRIAHGAYKTAVSTYGIVIIALKNRLRIETLGPGMVGEDSTVISPLNERKYTFGTENVPRTTW